MTATADAEAAATELTPLADYLAGAAQAPRAAAARPGPHPGVRQRARRGRAAPRTRCPAFDQAAIDGYAARWEDLAGGDRLAPSFGRSSGRGRSASTWSVTWAPRAGGRSGSPRAPASRSRPGRRCRSAPTWWSRVHWTDQGMAAVEILHAPKRGSGVRRAGDEIAGRRRCSRRPARTSPRRWWRCFAATGIGHVVVRPSPRVVVIATGDELVDVGPGQPARSGGRRQLARADRGRGGGGRARVPDRHLRRRPGGAARAARGPDAAGRPDHHHRRHRHRARATWCGGSSAATGRCAFTERRRVHRRVALPGHGTLGFGTVGGEEVPVVCLPGEPGRRADRLRGAGPAGDPAAGRRRAGVPAERAGAPAGDRLLAGRAARVPARRTSPSGAAAATRCSRWPVGRTRCPAWPRRTGCWCSASGSTRGRGRVHRGRPDARPAAMMRGRPDAPDGRPSWRTGDRRAAAPVPPRRRPGLVARSRIANEAWLAPWEPTPPGPWAELNSPRRVPAASTASCAGRAARRGDAVRGLPARRDGRGAAGRAAHPGQHRAAGVLLGVRRLLGRLAGRRPGRHPDRAGARRRPRVRRRRAAPHRGQHPAGEQAQPAGGGEARLPRGGVPPALPAHRRRLARSRRVRPDQRGRRRRGRAAGPLAARPCVASAGRSRRGAQSVRTALDDA